MAEVEPKPKAPAVADDGRASSTAAWAHDEAGRDGALAERRGARRSVRRAVSAAGQASFRLSGRSVQLAITRASTPRGGSQVTNGSPAAAWLMAAPVRLKKTPA